jgi:addiction module RelE/StbE family toxin
LRRLRWARAATDDLVAIADHYDGISHELRQRILSQVIAAPRLLRERPLIGPSAGLHGLRKWPVKHTPFVLLYRVTSDQIEIARVVHAAQNWHSE